MSRIGSFALFLLMVLLVTAGSHYYIWARLVRDVAWSRPVHRVLSCLVVCLAISLPVGQLLAHGLRPEHASPLVPILYVWMGLAMGLLALLGLSDLFESLLRVLRFLMRQPAADAAERLLVHRVAMSVVGVAAVVAVAFGLRGGLMPPTIKEVEIPLKRLPPALDGFVIVQLTDLHVGPTLQKAFVEDVVRRTNELNPDVVAITGDLADGSVENLMAHVAPLANLHPRLGSYFVTGNHEYYSGVEEWLRAINSLGIVVLRNQRVSIGDGVNSFDLVGIDDEHAAAFGNGHGAELEKALANRDPKRMAVLLAHQPKAALRARDRGIDLLLTGHTHGGQAWPFRYLVTLQQPLIAGLAQLSSLVVYVSSGTGHWGPPLRLFTTAEITKIVLRSAVAERG